MTTAEQSSSEDRKGSDDTHPILHIGGGDPLAVRAVLCQSKALLYRPQEALLVTLA
jgi:hypothetical protein